MCRNLLILQLPKTATKVSALIKPAPYQSGMLCLFLWCPFAFCIGPVLKPTIGQSVRRPKKWALGTRHPQGKSQVSHQHLCREAGGPYIRCYWTACQYVDTWEMLAVFTCLFEELCTVHCDKERNGCYSGLASAVGSRLDTDTQLEAEA